MSPLHAPDLIVHRVCWLLSRTLKFIPLTEETSLTRVASLGIWDKELTLSSSQPQGCCVHDTLGGSVCVCVACCSSRIQRRKK